MWVLIATHIWVLRKRQKMHYQEADKWFRENQMLRCRRMTLDPHLSPLITLDPSVTETWSGNTESNRRKHKQYPGRDGSR